MDAKGKILLDSAKIKGVAGPKVASDDPVVVLGPGDWLAIEVEWIELVHDPSRPARSPSTSP